MVGVEEKMGQEDWEKNPRTLNDAPNLGRSKKCDIIRHPFDMRRKAGFGGC